MDRFSDRADLEQIAARAKNKQAMKRARGLLREMDERAAELAAAAAADAAAAALPESLPIDSARPGQAAGDAQADADREAARREAEAAADDDRRAALAARMALCDRLELAAAESALAAAAAARAEWEGMPPLAESPEQAALARRFEQAARACERRHAEWADAERRRGRLPELVDEAVTAAAMEDLGGSAPPDGDCAP